jgi:hypothetical protein
MVGNDPVKRIDLLGLAEGQFVVTPAILTPSPRSKEEDVLKKAGKTATGGYNAEYIPADPCACKSPDTMTVVQIIHNGQSGMRNSDGYGIDHNMTDDERRDHLKAGGSLPPMSNPGSPLEFKDAPQNPNNKESLWEMEICAICVKTGGGGAYSVLGCTKLTMQNRDAVGAGGKRLNHRALDGTGTSDAVDSSSTFNDAAKRFMTP